MTDDFTMAEATSLLTSLIRIPSFSREEEQVADYLQITLKPKECKPEGKVITYGV